MYAIRSYYDNRLAQEASSEAARRKSIEKELEWVRQNPKGRQAKSKARMARFEELNSQDYQKRNETNELFIPPGQSFDLVFMDIKMPGLNGVQTFRELKKLSYNFV